MQIKESAENYLETIFVLSQKNGSVRSIDVANEMGFTKASISIAMKRLREDEYIVVENDGAIHLTDKGKDIAARVYERHQLIAKILIALGVNEETAREAMRLASHKLPCKTKFVMKEKEIEEGGNE